MVGGDLVLCSSGTVQMDLPLQGLINLIPALYPCAAWDQSTCLLYVIVKNLHPDSILRM